VRRKNRAPRGASRVPALTVVTCLALVTSLVGTASAQQATASAANPQCPWVGSTAPVGQRVAAVMAKMTLDDKIAMVHGAGGSAYVGYVPPNPGLCIPALKLEDGPAGVADGMTGVTQLPAPVAGAASWDPALMKTYGSVIGSEERGKGANVDLGPTVNIVRDPRWGRSFESLGEDPYLAGQVGASDIEGIQRQGVMAQVKHWDVYNQETYRNTPADDANISDRAMHEIYMPAFEPAIKQAHASSVMCSYSTVNGHYACENAYLLGDVLKKDWNFPGFVTSDWGATHSTADSANNGLDMQMPDDSYFGAPLKLAVQAGQVPAARLNDMVSRILTEEFRFGLFDHAPVGSPGAVVTTSHHAAVARDIAEQGTVLLKNSGGILPFTGKAHSIAVIGDDAGKGAMSAGGGSASVQAPHVVTPYQGIAKRAGSGVKVTYAQGNSSGTLPAVPSQYLTPSQGTGNGLTGQYFNNMNLSGTPVLTRADANIDSDFGGNSPGPGVNATGWSVKWTGTLTAPTTGRYTFSLTSDDGSRLFLNGQNVIDNWRDQAPTTETGTVDLTAGQPVKIEVDYYQNGGGSSVTLGWQPPNSGSLLDQAVATAKSADVAVVFASKFESEGGDLADINLSDDQNTLISAVAAANPKTIVVLNTGSAVTMPWVDSVKGVLEAWYPGQEDGNAIASVLFGDTNPSGKLPVTFPKSLNDVPASTPAQWPGVGGKVQYSEDLLVGYRWYDTKHIVPLFPFGYGLSYTDFAFSHLVVAPNRLTPSGHVTVGASVTNTGERAGAEVVQVYVGDPASTGEPARQLKGFRKIELAPGQTSRVTFQLDARAFSSWDTTAHTWKLNSGTYHVMIGDSSANLPVSGSLVITSKSGATPIK
jgi:beta-glucosidase